MERVLYTYGGTRVVLHELPGGAIACPICGFPILGEPPYRETTACSPDGESEMTRGFATGSNEMCPCCGTEFGFDDYVDASSEGSTISEKWRELREKWLQGVEVDGAIRLQLANIGIFKPGDRVE
jgi:hypothetical protein